MDQEDVASPLVFRDIVIHEEEINSRLFDDIIKRDKPALIRNCPFGDCTRKWNLEYLNKLIGDQEVSIHESNQSDLNFLAKNFKYRKCKFSQFSQMLTNPSEDHHVYLRSTTSLSSGRLTRAARIEEDFPSLRKDWRPPKFIPCGQENSLYHSSVLRIASSNVQIWTHFDLYDNVLVQIEGTKRVILFDPSDTKYLSVDGDKSPVNCFDDPRELFEKFPSLSLTKPYKCLLQPGECLFIPSLWWHNIRTVSTDTKPSISSAGYSIGFNIFWRDPQVESRAQYSEGDIYGNRNLVPFDAALANLEKALLHINKLPEKYSAFYKILLLERFQKRLNAHKKQ